MIKFTKHLLLASLKYRQNSLHAASDLFCKDFDVQTLAKKHNICQIRGSDPNNPPGQDMSCQDLLQWRASVCRHLPGSKHGFNVTPVANDDGGCIHQSINKKQSSHAKYIYIYPSGECIIGVILCAILRPSLLLQICMSRHPARQHVQSS